MTSSRPVHFCAFLAVARVMDHAGICRVSTLRQRKRPSGFGGMGRKLYSKTQYGQRKIPLAILGPLVLSPSAFTPSPRAFEVFIATGSGRPVHLRALPTGAFEIWLFGNCGVAALQAQEPSFRARQHWLEIPTQHAIWTSNDMVIHFGLPFSRPTW
jgi:hypothetical protein